MDWMIILAVVLSTALVFYLVAALLVPEKFS